MFFYCDVTEIKLVIELNRLIRMCEKKQDYVQIKKELF